MKSRILALNRSMATSLLLALSVLGANSEPALASDKSPKVELNIVHSGGDGQSAVSRKPLRLAVSEKVYDDLAVLLNKLGDGYKQFDTLKQADLQKREKLREYDVIFLTCARIKSGDVLRKTALREFVEQKGGTLYASDLRFAALREAFPEFIDTMLLKPGRQQQTVKARILDAGLQALLGKEVDLFFESEGWEPAAFQKDKVKVYLRGEYLPSLGEGKVDAPLLVKFEVGKGTVIFSSFHNASQGAAAEKLLNYVIVSAVTARQTAETNRKLLKAGVAPVKSRLIRASAKDPKVTHTFSKKKVGRLLFALAFNPVGDAKLKLTVKGPQGKVTTHEDSEAFLLEITNASLGEWEYTVEALNLPYPNFPFVVTVAEPK